MVAYLLHARTYWSDWLRFAISALAAYLIASPWIPPSTIGTIRFNAQTVGGDFTSTGRHLLWAVPLIAALVFFIRKLPIFVIFASIMAILTLSQFWFHFAIVPQPERYHLEMDLGIIFAVVLSFPLFPHKRAQQAAFWIAMVFLRLARLAAASLCPELDQAAGDSGYRGIPLRRMVRRQHAGRTRDGPRARWSSG